MRRRVMIDWTGRCLCPVHGRQELEVEYEAGLAPCGCVWEAGPVMIMRLTQIYIMYSMNISDQKGGTKGHTEGSNFAYTCIWRCDRHRVNSDTIHPGSATCQSLAVLRSPSFRPSAPNDRANDGALTIESRITDFGRRQTTICRGERDRFQQLGDRDLNPKFLIQSQMFCRLNYPRSTMISYHGAPHRASFGGLWIRRQGAAAGGRQVSGTVTVRRDASSGHALPGAAARRGGSGTSARAPQVPRRGAPSRR